MTTPASPGYSLSIQLMKRVLATHVHYAGRQLLEQMDDEDSGSGGNASGIWAEFHNEGLTRSSAQLGDADYSDPKKIDLVTLAALGPKKDPEKMFSRNRGTKHFTTAETEKHQQNKAPGKGYVRSVRIVATTPIPNAPGPRG